MWNKKLLGFALAGVACMTAAMTSVSLERAVADSALDWRSENATREWSANILKPTAQSDDLIGGFRTVIDPAPSPSEPAASIAHGASQEAAETSVDAALSRITVTRRPDESGLAASGRHAATLPIPDGWWPLAASIGLVGVFELALRWRRRRVRRIPQAAMGLAAVGPRSPEEGRRPLPQHSADGHKPKRYVSRAA